ncbi:MAG: GNAT family N-acetyltransferase [Methylicorpusculum sp.]|uniref:GNAT family N-acetyltransferase n=1 Tax=Methylicorpusculum sp. TaxID=2713644 RepID=UPI00271B5111|nr:GNAT family N-acetyltransferase [Methylicorpusculum sp.]MDO8846750.1 GNAT family N-acetyltransferase [Methylicorpusculum sp.]MDO8940379.1 GNAT family N-acetyltransferase [Methylicorpusculum sp.]MDP2179753.1 GNAT family N-acetyltransferase [Methylicorpusculum sp.]MDP2203603.1 GNAT family N-acetyltransferase [Methylicorpusculum sp.]
MLSSPILLATDHQLDDFACNVDSLNDWLKKRAYQNQLSGTSRTYVVLEGKRVVGYYCLASGALELNDAPTQVRRNMPNPIPVAILGRLAVDKSFQGKGLGVALLQDAVVRTAQAGGILGIRGLLVHALSIEAKAFYEHHGFVASPTQAMTLILSLKGHNP